MVLLEKTTHGAKQVQQDSPPLFPSSFPLLFSSYLFLSVPPAEGKDQDLVIRRARQGGQESLPAVVSRFESDEGNVR